MISSLDPTIVNFLSLSGLGIGLICSTYLIYDWLKHRRTQPHVFLWAIGLVFFYIFFVPFITVNFGGSITLSEWRGFFSSTIPLVFLGWAFVLWGIIQAKSRKPLLTLPLYLVLWIVASFIFYAFRFAPTPYEKVLSIIGIVVFFLAIHILILITLRRWFKEEKERGSTQIKGGVIVIALAVALSIVRYLMIIIGLVRLPKDFWFLAIADFDFGFILRSVVIILLAVGLLLAHRRYTSIKPQTR